MFSAALLSGGFVVGGIAAPTGGDFASWTGLGEAIHSFALAGPADLEQVEQGIVLPLSEQEMQRTVRLMARAGAECAPEWEPTFGTVSTGMNDLVRAFAVFDDGNGAALYAGGLFTVAGGVEASRIARWDGTSWSPLGSGLNSKVNALAVFDDGTGPALYAGGLFSAAGGVATNRIAKWDGSEWAPLGSGVEGDSIHEAVLAMTVFDDGTGPALYVGGSFVTAGDLQVNRIARWDGASWSSVGDGMGGDVWALQVFDDGSGPALYAGGVFTIAGGGEANRVAKWDGTSWSPLGSGMNASVYALTVFDDGSGLALYAGGEFTTAGGEEAYRIAKWDGTSWSPLGDEILGEINTTHWVVALTVFDGGGGPALYVGGWFPTVGGEAVRGIAKWDGVSWSPLGDGLTWTTSWGTYARAIAVFDDGSGGGPALYTGGQFHAAGGVQTKYIAKWDGAQWGLVSGGVDGPVTALTLFDDGSGGGLELYAGVKTMSGFRGIRGIAKWDGTFWRRFESETNGEVLALTVFDDGSGSGPGLYAAGYFATVGGVTVNRIARWDGSNWSALDSGMGGGGTVHAMTVFDDGKGPALYAGGQFTTAGGVPANRIAKWDGSSWSPLGSGVDNLVRALTVFDDGSGGGPALYAGGWFTTAGGVEANGIAKWDGTSWSPLGSGIDFGGVRALTVFDDGSGGGPALYAGGSLTAAGGVTANRIAKWDGISWSPLGSGMNSTVTALTVFNDQSGSGPALYAGGWFTTAGGVAVEHIAKWDGIQWSSLDTGVNGLVYALTSAADESHERNSVLYVGGDFFISPAGDSFLAKWQGCPAQAAPCETDLNGDGVVDFSDLLNMLAAWGPCDACPADLNGDGTVDHSDLLIVLGAWGECD